MYILRLLRVLSKHYEDASTFHAPYTQRRFVGPQISPMRSSLPFKRPIPPAPESSQPAIHRSNQLSGEQFDIWEHAALLYHGYEWQDAADAFEYLALHIIDSTPSTLCALNASIIQARLGDFHQAQDILESIAQSERAFALTPYLLGIVEWELSNFIKAEACLKVCAHALRKGDVNYSLFGLDFMLRIDEVEALIELLRYGNGLRNNEQRRPPVPAALPADCIFEAPPRPSMNALGAGLKLFAAGKREYGESDRNAVSARNSTLLDSSPSRSNSLDHHDRRPSLSHRSLAAKDDAERASTAGGLLAERWWASRRQEGADQLPMLAPVATTQSPLQTCPVPDDIAQKDPEVLQEHDTSISIDSAAESTLPHENPPPLPRQESSRQRPATPYVARDARGEYHDIHELAHFLRNNAEDRPRPTLVARDARIEPGSTRELATFIRNANRDRLCIDPRTGRFSYDIARADLLIGAPLPVFNSYTKKRARKRRSAPQRFLQGLLLGLGGHGALPANEARAKQQEAASPSPTKTDSQREVRKDKKKGKLPLRIHVGRSGSRVDVVKASPLSQMSPSSTLHSQSTASPSTAKDILAIEAPAPLNLLLPNVYSPDAAFNPQPVVEPTKPPSPQLLVLDEPARRLSWPLGGIHTLHTAASSTSNLFAGSITSVERAERARDAALRMLEGRSRIYVPVGGKPQELSGPGPRNAEKEKAPARQGGHEVVEKRGVEKEEKRRKGSSAKFFGKLGAMRWSLDEGLSISK